MPTLRASPVATPSGGGRPHELGRDAFAAGRSGELASSAELLQHGAGHHYGPCTTPSSCLFVDPRMLVWHYIK
jgi:hypothetical protein